MRLIEKSWYQAGALSWLLLPLSGLFWLLSTLRRKAYAWGWFTQHRVGAPVVIVGNISVGGNGKTPLVIALCNLLRQHGFHPGVVSRGYGGKAKGYPRLVGADSLAEEVGDEPVLMQRHLSCPLVVDPDRVRGARYLTQRCGCDVIVSDDGLQHYRLGRDVEIVVMDGERRLGNGKLLPAGPLREGTWRLSTVDFIIVNGGQVAPGENLMSLAPGRLVNVNNPRVTMSVSRLEQAVVAAAGIGHPQRFFDLLVQQGVRVKQALSFPDHHQFAPGELPKERLLMTEKDAVKCRAFAHEDWWYLPVEAVLTAEFQRQFIAAIGKIKQ